MGTSTPGSGKPEVYAASWQEGYEGGKTQAVVVDDDLKKPQGGPPVLTSQQAEEAATAHLGITTPKSIAERYKNAYKQGYLQGYADQRDDIIKNREKPPVISSGPGQ